MKISTSSFGVVLAALLLSVVAAGSADANGRGARGGGHRHGVQHGLHHHGFHHGLHHHGHRGHGRFWAGVGIGIGVGVIGSRYYHDGAGYTAYVVPAQVYGPYSYHDHGDAPPEPYSKPAPDPIFYPRHGQSPAQTEADRQACNRWATTLPEALADATVFHRAVLACMEGRGYTVG